MVEPAKRITIMVDAVVDKKLRQLQSKIINETQSSKSYSSVINDSLRKALRI